MTLARPTVRHIEMRGELVDLRFVEVRDRLHIGRAVAVLQRRSRAARSARQPAPRSWPAPRRGAES